MSNASISRSTSMPTYKLPQIKDSLKFTKTQSIKSKDLAASQVSPETRLSPGPPNYQAEFSATHSGNPPVPSTEDINRITNSFLPSKKRSPETSPDPPQIPSAKSTSRLPRIPLRKAQKGLNTGPNWFNSKEKEPTDDFEPRFKGKTDSASKIFPTMNLQFKKIPETRSERFAHINPEEDLELANYVVNAENAFKTDWNKHKDLKDRKFYPENHPEFVKDIMRHNKKRDKVVEYREAMLKAKNMMNQKSF